MNPDRAVWALAVVVLVAFFYALAVAIEASSADTVAAPASTQRKADCPRCNP